MDPKDGFAIADYEDARAKRVLKFLIPILYREKPTRVTVTMGNTIFGALLGKRKSRLEDYPPIRRRQPRGRHEEEQGDADSTLPIPPLYGRESPTSEDGGL